MTMPTQAVAMFAPRSRLIPGAVPEPGDSTASLEAGSRRLVVLTNIPTPYRIHFFNRLAAELRRRDIGFGVLFCAKSEANRHWPFDPAALHFTYKILPGLHPRLGGVTFHLNPSVGHWLRRWKPTWLLSAGAWLMPTGLIALAALRSNECARFFWSEGHEDAVLHRTGLVPRLRRQVLQRYDGFAVPNRKSADYLARQLGTRPKCLPLPNIVDDSFYLPPSAEQRDSARRKHGIGASDVLIIQVAQLEERKGTLELVQGWAISALTHPHLRLVLVGAGTLELQVRAVAADAVKTGRLILTGPIAAQAVLDWLHAADAFALNSRRDPNPLSAIEAGLTGLPLLLSRKIGNFEELHQQGQTGFAIETVAADAVARTLDAYAALPPEKRGALGAASRSNAAGLFSTSAVVSAFADAVLNARGVSSPA